MNYELGRRLDTIIVLLEDIRNILYQEVEENVNGRDEKEGYIESD